MSAVATGCVGVARAGDAADASAAAGHTADSHPAQLGLASEALYAEHLLLPPLFIL